MESCVGACNAATAELYWIDGARFGFGLHEKYNFSSDPEEICTFYDPNGGPVISNSACGGGVKRKYVCEISCYETKFEVGTVDPKVFISCSGHVSFLVLFIDR